MMGMRIKIMSKIKRLASARGIALNLDPNLDLTPA